MKDQVLSENSYAQRMVRYENIHGIKPEYFDKFVAVIAARNGECLLDVGAGYGAVTAEIFSRNPNLNARYVLLEKSESQLERAKKELLELTGPEFFQNNVSFINKSISFGDFESEVYDTISAKTMIHELPEAEKLRAIQNMYHMLKTGGKLLMWQYNLNTNDEEFFNNVIGKKDELARFNTLIVDRHFPSEKDLFALLQSAGFHHIVKEEEFEYHLNTSNRLEEEFNNDMEILRTWNNFVLELLENYSDEFKLEHEFEFKDDNIHLTFKQGIYSARK